ncbi:anti-sigma factor family protein [Gorillibacterium massiliense]|uniref:anti-sigma factor family protein n=1 Tax=Gorillibacterium massiliense TaxID=1280390 RepID=UPI0004B63319|nr:zf-HC2 domain-containing protein [Gorillibacterium massiliense]
MMDHPTEWLSAYMDDEMELEQRQKMDRHLAECASCRALLSDLMDMQSQVAQFYHQVKAPDTLEMNIMKALEKESAASWITKTSTAIIPIMGIIFLSVIIFRFGSIWLKLFSVLFKFTVTAAYVISHIASSVPTVWVSALIMAVCLTLISGLSLRHILRSSAQ